MRTPDRYLIESESEFFLQRRNGMTMYDLDCYCLVMQRLHGKRIAKEVRKEVLRKVSAYFNDIR